jgi:site-specific recombinase
VQGGLDLSGKAMALHAGVTGFIFSPLASWDENWCGYQGVKQRMSHHHGAKKKSKLMNKLFDGVPGKTQIW